MDQDELPFLLGHLTPTGEGTVTAVADLDSSIVEMTVRGRWDYELHLAVATALRQSLAEQPSGLIVDLHDVGDPTGASAQLWPTAHRWGAAMQPPVPVVMCLPTQAPLAAILRRRWARYCQPMYATVPEARAALIYRRPRTDRLKARLAPDRSAAAAARGLVAEGCTAWRLPSVLHAAQQVVTELVVNAVEHAGTEMEVAVTRQRTGVHLAVGDGDPRLPRMRRFEGRREIQDPGLGLELVHMLSAAWGALPTRTGKVVWATVKPRSCRWLADA
ncbi:ATP-binding protein [Couchioplanes azureus]|uniref:ATP-binding protein n=1 Tax=Couchioplanes caeruleus TaxID=56438 RepID=UPI0016717709|nr:ATP-binding protein [Couchioplanes caeruleus]GGQ40326.1 ATP-binding protein [Couchioplanes caeruleus subsp. azureus]